MNQKFGTRRERAKAETREIIKDTAYALFQEKGYAETTMRELAAHAGVGLGTIFQHFPDKASLLVAAFEEELGSLVDQGLSTLPVRADLKTQLLHMMRPILTWYAEHHPLARVLIKEIFFLEGKAAEKLQEIEMDVARKLGGLFVAAVERGEIDPRTDVADAVTALWAIYSLTLLNGLRSEQLDVDAQLSWLGRLFDQQLKGIQAK